MAGTKHSIAPRSAEISRLFKKPETKRRTASWTTLNDALKRGIIEEREVVFLENAARQGLLKPAEMKIILTKRTPYEIFWATKALTRRRGKIKWETFKEALLADSKEKFWEKMGIKKTGVAPPHRNSQ